MKTEPAASSHPSPSGGNGNDDDFEFVTMGEEKDTIPEIPDDVSKVMVYLPPRVAKPDATETPAKPSKKKTPDQPPEATDLQQCRTTETNFTGTTVSTSQTEQKLKQEEELAESLQEHNFLGACLLLVALIILALIAAVKLLVPAEEVYVQENNNYKTLVVSNKDFENTIYTLVGGLVLVLFVGSIGYAYSSYQPDNDPQKRKKKRSRQKWLLRGELV